jgi:hypothetical protein
MKSYRSAMGKTVDMAALAARNEHTRAVGNMRVNARGDTIDANGRVIRPVTDKVNEAYGKTVGNKSAQVTKRTVTAKPTPPAQPTTQKIEMAELTQAERELEESFEDDIEVEQIKAKETKK